ncbi:formate dehydrogenase accessory sulfurtransferase FdhD [Pandoraea cepalis]|uniref:Sulfur carrier protein FdhD n=1 Tax=Pandoraea cepalis TaxID=2508294 RepID=A0AAW7MH45_9BURK|nr:formate dehydrogenase accessory sulfurtransferase FdhD [Pandoraea cepalis]MDN4571958.1 formate dehydrogenase accessory sulfurtransferase FdhD [Pandoraea cepalis]MDN4578513.1 formate dehydrogenase accessory sulfurtransferase FdhD [Pandoraea cepalis]
MTMFNPSGDRDGRQPAGEPQGAGPGDADAIDETVGGRVAPVCDVVPVALDPDSLAPSATVAVRRFRHGTWQSASDELAEEVPVALEFNGISHVVMLATPADVEDFALGFALSEGILNDRRECYGIDVTATTQGVTAHLDVSSRAFAGLKERRRNLTGRTGCGLCGTESLDQVLRPLPTAGAPLRVSHAALAAAYAGLARHQPLNGVTGAVHGAAWCSPQGEILCLREDVGRHNALDKLIGALARSEQPFDRGFVLMTSRASVEIVQKAAQVGIPMVAAVSAATALAVQTAAAAGVTLVGFVRGEQCVIYTGGAALDASA